MLRKAKQHLNSARGIEEETPKKKRTFYGKLPTKKKQKFGRNARKGGDRKTSASQIRYRSAIDNLAAPIYVTPPQDEDRPSRKPTINVLKRKLGYEVRSKRQLEKKYDRLERLVESKDQELTEKDQQLERKDSLLAAKSKDCQTLAALAQERRRESNEAEQAAAILVYDMKSDCTKRIETATKLSVDGQADAHRSILVERAYQASKQSSYTFRSRTQLVILICITMFHSIFVVAIMCIISL